MTIRIHGTDDYLESQEAQITYVKTAGDLAEITSANSSFSWAMKFPKTPNNTRVLDGLGLVGSGSRKPYVKIYVDLLDNGLPIALKALLNIKETTDHYGIFIQEGFVDFLKDITSDTIGDTLDLSALDHERNIGTIIASFALTEPYAYLISDVNGAYGANISDTTNLRASHMVPFARVMFLWDAIFAHYGWTYSLPVMAHNAIDALWMSYPSEIVYGENPEDTLQVAEVGATDTTALPDQFTIQDQTVIWETATLDPDYVAQQAGAFITRFVIQQAGNYLVRFHSRGLVRLETQYAQVSTTTYTNQLYVNGSLVATGNGSTSTETAEVQLLLYAGDIVRMQVRAQRIEQTTDFEIDVADLDIYHLGQGEVSFTQAFIKYRVADFIKEMMVREALTPFVYAEDRHIQFLSLDDRFNAEAVDWTDRFVRRTKETYLYRDYAQENHLVHRYDQEGADFNNGTLLVQNENLETEKDIYQSQSFSPEDRLTPFLSGGDQYQVPILKMFEVEVKEQDGVLVGTYKHLKDRFFFVRHQISQRSIYIDGAPADNIPLVAINGTVFSDIVAARYVDFFRMAADAKVHTVEVTIGLADIVHLDLRKLYYFGQEAGYYILNRLSYRTGKVSQGEFIRVVPRIRTASFSNGFSNGFAI